MIAGAGLKTFWVGASLDFSTLAIIGRGSHSCQTDADDPGRCLRLALVQLSFDFMKPSMAGPSLAATSLALCTVGLAEV
jgi:hypothetical protein